MVHSHTKRIFNLCLRFTGRRDEAEDLTQETFIRIYRNLRSFRSKTGSFQSWILSVARNLVIDHYRKERRLRFPFGSEEMEGMHLEDCRTPSPSRAFEQAEASRLLSKALIALDPDLRKAVVLRDLEGLSYQEVAETTGVSEGTVKSRIFRARMRLTKIFIGQGAPARSMRKPLPLGGLGEPVACCPD
jgi:RNA polymerase sigma-70 factor (ECF subfamily)